MREKDAWKGRRRKIEQLFEKKLKTLSLSLFHLNIINMRVGKTIVDLCILPCHENNYLCNNDAEQIKSFIEPSNATAIYLLRKEKNV